MSGETPNASGERPDAPAAIKIEHLEARYGDKVILHDVSCEVRRGEVFAIVGGSGCGKTTLLRHMIGLLRPAAGRVLIEGDDVAAADEEQLQRIQQRFGVSFQAGALFGSLTLGQNIALPLEEYTNLPPDMIALLVRMKLAMVHLDGFEEFMVSELSGGMKKRAALARALALDPRILFFDEPSAGLDPITSVELDELIVRSTAASDDHRRRLARAAEHLHRSRPAASCSTRRPIDHRRRPAARAEEKHPDPRVHAFFNRQPTEQAQHRRDSRGD
jgi:phospholipid/cholesterol/gamma-HCH transport system ATP-binding protein